MSNENKKQNKKQKAKLTTLQFAESETKMLLAGSDRG
jgi:hypothetical protein